MPALPDDPRLAVAALVAAVLIPLMPTLPALISYVRDRHTPDPGPNGDDDGGCGSDESARALLSQLVGGLERRAHAAEARVVQLQDRLDQLETEHYRQRYQLETQLAGARAEAAQLRTQIQVLIARHPREVDP